MTNPTTYAIISKSTGDEPHKKGIDTMFNATFLENAKNLNDLTSRMDALTKLCALPIGAEFYASDLGLSGGTVNSLDRYGIIKRVRGKEKPVFVCIDEDEELYKKFEAQCWTVVNPHVLGVKYKEYCMHMATMYSMQAVRLG